MKIPSTMITSDLLRSILCLTQSMRERDLKEDRRIIATEIESMILELLSRIEIAE